MEQEEFQDHFFDSVEQLVLDGHRVIVLEGVPELPSSSYAECLLKNMDDCSIDASVAANRGETFQRLKSRLIKAYPQIEWVNPADAICDEGRCKTVLNDTPLYRDESHLNNVGAKALGRHYVERFGNPLLSKPAQDRN